MEEIIKGLRKYLKEWKELGNQKPTDPQDHSGWKYFHEEEKSIHGVICNLYDNAEDKETLKAALDADEAKTLEGVLNCMI